MLINNGNIKPCKKYQEDERKSDMIKQSLKTVLLLSVLWLMVIQPIAAAEALSDITSDHWAKEEINYLTDKGIIGGYPDGSFKPNHPVTRLQAVQMILKSKDIPLTDLQTPELIDVTPSSYGYGAIAKAVELGIIHGKTNEAGERYFDASGNLTRAQMAKVLSLAYDLDGESSAAFPDVPSSHWAHEHVQHLIGNGITEGSNGHYNPNATMTRGQFSVMMARILHDDFKVDGLTKPKPEPKPEPKPAPAPEPKPEPKPEVNIPAGIPDGAKFIEYSHNQYVFSYNKKLSDKSTISKVTFVKEYSYVSFVGTDRDNERFVLSYDGTNIRYKMTSPNLGDEEHFAIMEIGDQFLSAFGL